MESLSSREIHELYAKTSSGADFESLNPFEKRVAYMIGIAKMADSALAPCSTCLEERKETTRHFLMNKFEPKEDYQKEMIEKVIDEVCSH